MMGPHLRCLHVDRLALQSDQHANTPWPWEVLRVHEAVTATQLLRLPNPAQRVQPELERPQLSLFHAISVTEVSVCTNAQTHALGP